jgi:prepilin-type N-terminal cleavage/methylation domain-containing protein
MMLSPRFKPALRAGFTLIELSIVLVIIGLIIGGVLVGESLISAATIRSQIAQIERYNTAANTFIAKYGYLPGDLTSSLASQFGFVTRAGSRGRGDGNGVLEGVSYGTGDGYGWNEDGENLFFWEDLSKEGLIGESFSTATDADRPAITSTTTPNFSAFIPSAKIGNGNYLYIYSTAGALLTTTPGNNVNYFGLTVPSVIISGGNLTCGPGLTVTQAQSIDSKVDDGLPLSGRITTNYMSGSASDPPSAQSPNAPTPSASTCYDTTSKQYSMSQNGGSNVNCALSFMMQGVAR